MITDEKKLHELRAILDALCPADHGYFVLLTPRNANGNAVSSFLSNAPVGDWPLVMEEAAKSLRKPVASQPLKRRRR